MPRMHRERRIGQKRDGERENDMDALDRLIAKELEDPEFEKEWAASEYEYQVSRAVIRARIERGMTQKELARASGTDQRLISRVETGETLPTVRTLGKIARGLGDDLVIAFVPRHQGHEDGAMEG